MVPGGLKTFKNVNIKLFVGEGSYTVWDNVSTSKLELITVGQITSSR